MSEWTLSTFEDLIFLHVNRIGRASFLITRFQVTHLTCSISLGDDSSLQHAGYGKMPDYELVFTDFLSDLALNRRQKTRADSASVC